MRTATKFDSLQSEWDRLFQDCGLSVFQSFEWKRTWWECFGEGESTMELHLLVLRSGDETIGIAPFFIETHQILPLWNLRRLALIGSGLSDYLDLMVSPGFEEESAALVTAYITNPALRVDVIHLEDLSDRSRLHLPLFQALEKSTFRGRRFIHQMCPRTNLQESWEKTLAGFATHRRKRITYQRNALPKRFDVVYERPGRGKYSEADFDEFVAIHQAQWRNLGRQGIFGKDANTRFHRKVARLFDARGWLFLTFLRLNGKRAAANYAFNAKGEICTYLNGMLPLPEASKFSPGRVLHGYTMEDGNRNGAGVYDFLRGSERYKYSLNAVDIPNWTILMYNRESFLPDWGFRILLLIRSLGSRTVQELLMFRLVVQENGLFSRRTVGHLHARTHAVLRDGLKKAQEPEKPVLMILGLLRAGWESTLHDENLIWIMASAL